MRVNVLLFVKVLFAAGHRVRMALSTVVRSLLSRHSSSVAKGFRAARILPLRMSLLSSPQLCELSLHLGDPNFGHSVESVTSAFLFCPPESSSVERGLPSPNVQCGRSLHQHLRLLPARIAWPIHDCSMLRHRLRRLVPFWMQPITLPLLRTHEVPS